VSSKEYSVSFSPRPHKLTQLHDEGSHEHPIENVSDELKNSKITELCTYETRTYHGPDSVEELSPRASIRIYRTYTFATSTTRISETILSEAIVVGDVWEGGGTRRGRNPLYIFALVRVPSRRRLLT
jgi:hypothetical protein